LGNVSLKNWSVDKSRPSLHGHSQESEKCVEIPPWIMRWEERRDSKFRHERRQISEKEKTGSKGVRRRQ
jgi:hypothetical protein